MISNTTGGGMADVNAAKVWRDKHNFKNSWVVADPGFSLVPPNKTSIGTPTFVVVDPRTQTVVDWYEGTFPDPHKVAADLAKKNAANAQ